MQDPREEDDDDVTVADIAAMKRHSKMNGDGWPQEDEEDDEQRDE
jgi:hypothetical protein